MIDIKNSGNLNRTIVHLIKIYNEGPTFYTRIISRKIYVVLYFYRHITVRSLQQVSILWNLTPTGIIDSILNKILQI